VCGEALEEVDGWLCEAAGHLPCDNHQ
jgi:hypothetical protein